MPGYVAKGLRDAAHMLFAALKRAEYEMHILACVVSGWTVYVRNEFC
jgi:hypothetical protein